jgi:aldose 1-epimerase
MAIPLLYPWANRLSRWAFPVAGREVAIERERTPLRVDEGGLPMHGLLSAVRGWTVAEHDDARLLARFDFAAHEALMASFPFPHALEYEASLTPDGLSVALTVQATGDAPVPIAFGFHPYLQLPDVDRAEWRVEIPVTEQLVLDDAKLPTGERKSVQVDAGPLGGRTFDDAYLAPSGPFVLEGGGRRIELAFEAGYPYAQVFAPPSDALIAFEPMTAPTNALVEGPPMLAPGERYRAAFSIRVAGP